MLQAELSWCGVSGKVDTGHQLPPGQHVPNIEYDKILYYRIDLQLLSFGFSLFWHHIWQCSGLTPGGLGGGRQNRVRGIEIGLAACKARAQPSTISLAPMSDFNYVLFCVEGREMVLEGISCFL